MNFLKILIKCAKCVLRQKCVYLKEYFFSRTFNFTFQNIFKDLLSSKRIFFQGSLDLEFWTIITMDHYYYERGFLTNILPSTNRTIIVNFYSRTFGFCSTAFRTIKRENFKKICSRT